MIYRPNGGEKIMEKFKKTKRFKSIIVFVIIFFCVCFACFCGTSAYFIEEADIPRDVQVRIREAQEINFGETIDGQWESLIILPPYTDAKTARKNFDINLNRLKNSSIEYGKGQALFLFCGEEQIESYFYIKYPVVIDYDSFSHYERIPRAEAVFSSVKEGEIWKLVKNSG